MAMTVGDVARSLENVKDMNAAAKFPSIRYLPVNDGESATPRDDLEGEGGLGVFSRVGADLFGGIVLLLLGVFTRIWECRWQ